MCQRTSAEKVLLGHSFVIQYITNIPKLDARLLSTALLFEQSLIFKLLIIKRCQEFDPRKRLPARRIIDRKKSQSTFYSEMIHVHVHNHIRKEQRESISPTSHGIVIKSLRLEKLFWRSKLTK